MSVASTWVGAALLLVTGAGFALAQVAPQPIAPLSTESLHVRSLAAQCAQCHGTEGHATADGEVPGLAGMPATYLIEQMKAFRGGTRSSTVMQQLAKGFSESQVEQLARYFAAQNVARDAAAGAQP
jgi:cytochrome c553